MTPEQLTQRAAQDCADRVNETMAAGNWTPGDFVAPSIYKIAVRFRLYREQVHTDMVEIMHRLYSSGHNVADAVEVVGRVARKHILPEPVDPLAEWLGVEKNRYFSGHQQAAALRQHFTTTPKEPSDG